MRVHMPSAAKNASTGVNPEGHGLLPVAEEPFAVVMIASGSTKN